MTRWLQVKLSQVMDWIWLRRDTRLSTSVLVAEIPDDSGTAFSVISLWGGHSTYHKDDHLEYHVWNMNTYYMLFAYFYWIYFFVSLQSGRRRRSEERKIKIGVTRTKIETGTRIETVKSVADPDQGNVASASMFLLFEIIVLFIFKTSFIYDNQYKCL